MYSPGQKLDYYVSSRFRGAVYVIRTSKSGKTVLVHFVHRPRWDSMYVRPDKLVIRNGPTATPTLEN